MGAEGKRWALAFYFSVRIWYVSLISKCKGESNACLAAGLSRQGHVWITADQIVRFHTVEFDEMFCKLDSTEYARSFEQNPTLPDTGWTWTLENKINEVLGSKREDWFSDPLFDLAQNTVSSRIVLSTWFASAVSIRPCWTCERSRINALTLVWMRHVPH